MWDGQQWTHSGMVWNGTRWAAPVATGGWWHRNRAGLIVAGVVMAVILVGLFSTALKEKSPSPSTSSEGDALSAWVVCQQEMDKRLKAPATAGYPSRSEFSIA